MGLQRLARGLGYGFIAVAVWAGAVLPVRARDNPSVSDFMRPLAWTQLSVSPSGRYIAALTPDASDSHRRVLVVLDSGSGQIIHTMAFASPLMVYRYRWAALDRLVMSLAMYHEGEEPIPTGALRIADPDGGHPLSLYGLPSASPGLRTPHPGLALLIDSAPSNEDAIWVTVNTLGDDGPRAAIERVEVHQGEVHALGISPVPGARLLVDHAGVVRAAYSDQTATGAMLWMRTDDQAPWVLINDPRQSHVSMVPLGFARDNAHLYMRVSESNKPHRIEVMDTTSRQRNRIYQGAFADPGDLRPTFDGKDYYAVVTHDGVAAVHYFDDESQEALAHHSVSALFPNQLADFVSVSSDDRYAILRVNSDRNPGDYYWVDLERQHLRHLFAAAPWLAPEAMRPMEPITLEARDGLTLHGFLTRPAGKAPHPMVVLPHGGPVGIVDQWAFNPEVQLLATQGFAVLQVNYRGSSGYGAWFQALGDRQWGLGMQDDVTDATRWAIEAGVTSKGNICIYGISYGGYAALEGTVKEPDLYRCAIGYAGIYDLRVQRAASDTLQSGVGRAYLHRALGEDADDLLHRSPLSGVDRIKANILLLHGKKDRRVPFENFEAFTSALQEHGKRFETVVEPTEGHGFFQLQHRAAAYTTILDFLRRNLLTPQDKVIEPVH